MAGNGRRRASSIGGYMLRATRSPNGPNGYTEAGRAAFEAGFYRAVDEDAARRGEVLDPEEREARVRARRSAYFRQLRNKGVRKQQRAKERKTRSHRREVA